MTISFFLKPLYPRVPGVEYITLDSEEARRKREKVKRQKVYQIEKEGRLAVARYQTVTERVANEKIRRRKQAIVLALKFMMRK